VIESPIHAAPPESCRDHSMNTMIDVPVARM
jgi:hypothetical protein